MAPIRHRIFISHSHLDNDFGIKLAHDLRRVLADEDAVFYDVLGGLHGGERWWEKIVEELTARDVFLLVLSPDAMNSVWVRREIDVALNENKDIIPLLFRPCSMRADLKILHNISFLAPTSYEAAFQDVLGALGLPKEAPLARKERTSPTIDSSSILIQQMEAAFADHDWPDVIRKASYLIKHTSGNVSSTVYRLQGLALGEEGEVQQAQEALETALALVSDRQQRLTLLSDYTALLAQQEQWAKVLQQSREALRLLPNDPGWLATQQQAQSKLTQKAPFALPFQKKTRISDQKPSRFHLKTKEEWINEGAALDDLKRYEEAIAAFDQAIRLDPNDATAYNKKGTALYNLGRCKEAIAAYEQIIRLDPNDATAYNKKGNALLILRRNEEAIAAFDQAIRLDPNFARAYYNKGEALEYLKRYEEAIATYDQIARLNPNDATAYWYKGNALYILNRYEEALTAFDQAIGLDPNNAFAYNNKGNALRNLKRSEEAIAVFDQAIRLDPNFARAYYNKSVALEALNKGAEARQAYDKAKQLGYGRFPTLS